jgi:hypothetical protein
MRPKKVLQLIAHMRKTARSYRGALHVVALKSGNAPQARADTQRDWLVKLRKERGLLDAVRLAGPFIISSQAKQ